MIVGAQDAAAEAGSVLLIVSSEGVRGGNARGRGPAGASGRRDDVRVFYHQLITPRPGPDRRTGGVAGSPSPSTDISSVVPDEVGGARGAVEELLAAGHRRIGFVTNEEGIAATTLRLAGFREALLGTTSPSIRPWLSTPTRPPPAGSPVRLTCSVGRTADRTVLLTDRMARGDYQACHELGLKIPGDVSLVGFDDQERGQACPSGGLSLRLSRLRPAPRFRNPRAPRSATVVE